MTGLTFFFIRELKFLRTSKHSFFKRNTDGKTYTCALRRSVIVTVSSSATEKVSENIAKDISHIHAGKIESACTAGASIKRGMTKLIILSALFRIAQNGICLLRFLKFFLTLFISRMHIRMILLCNLSICTLNLRL